MTDSEEFLTELEDLAENDKITTKVAVQMMLKSQVRVYRRLRTVETSQSEVKRQMENLTSVSASMSTMDDIVKDLTAIKKVLENNVVLQMGEFIRDHKPIAWALFITLIILSNLWFVDGIRVWAMTELHFPPPLIEFLSDAAKAIPTATP